MNPRRQKRLLLVISLVAGLGVAISLMLYALKQNIDLFYTPSQIVMGEPASRPEVGQRLRIGGLVAPGTLARDSDSLRVSFKLLDDMGGMVTVTYDGILPDLFREGQGIVAQGVLDSPDTVAATEVLAKHDEEYMPPEVAEATQQAHQKLNYTPKQVAGGN